MNSSLRLVIFDCDGTLVDSQHYIERAMRSAFATIGREAPGLEAVREVVGLSLEHSVERLAPDTTPEQRTRLVRAYRDAFYEIRSSGEPEPLYPGCAECLRELQVGGDLLAVATGKGRRGLEMILRAHGLFESFTSLQTADDGPGKPNPTILHQAMRECGVESSRTLMVGDTSFDMEMARNAGVFAVGVSWGYHSSLLLAGAGAQAIAERFEDLPGILGGLCPRS